MGVEKSLLLDVTLDLSYNVFEAHSELRQCLIGSQLSRIHDEINMVL